jgi:hypothetical protein
MKKLILLVLVATTACKQQKDKQPGSDTTGTVVITNDTIPATRTVVNEAPVASYSQPVPDELNNWQFAVQVYETKRTFHFILRMQYKELRITDSLNIPNFGIQPVVELKKGPEPFSCIIGFRDKKGVFKEYKKAYVSKEKFKFTTLNHYYIASYKTPQKAK